MSCPCPSELTQPANMGYGQYVQANDYGTKYDMEPGIPCDTAPGFVLRSKDSFPSKPAVHRSGTHMSCAEEVQENIPLPIMTQRPTICEPPGQLPCCAPTAHAPPYPAPPCNGQLSRIQVTSPSKYKPCDCPPEIRQKSELRIQENNSEEFVVSPEELQEHQEKIKQNIFQGYEPGDIQKDQKTPQQNSTMPKPRGQIFCYPPEIQDKLTDGPPPYFPQPEDSLPYKDPEMGPLGPWATGKVDWGPLAGLTGTRPVVDRYSLARFSRGEWRKHNEDVMKQAANAVQKQNLVDFNGRQCMAMNSGKTDKAQEANTQLLIERDHEVHHWMTEIERSLIAMAEEINLLEGQRQRLKTSLGILQLPEAIAGECLMLRTNRMENELVRDTAEEELMKEVALIKEIGDLLNRLLTQMEDQLECNKAVKQNLEMDWCDKKDAHEVELINISLKHSSPDLMWRAGATRFTDGQSTPEGWAQKTRESLALLEAERLKSADLRQYLEKILTEAIKDLRTQADRVEEALNTTIIITSQCLQRLENDLKATLQRISDSENLVEELRQLIRNHDLPMKKAQTRLYNRLLRRGAENCRDKPQFGLVDEVKTIGENVSAIMAHLKQAEEGLASLVDTRYLLEGEIIAKRKSLQIDGERCKTIREHYPSATALSGFS